MTVPVFVDTNVLIYSRDQGHPEKAAQSAAWLRRLRPNGLVVSPQVLNETFAVSLRKFRGIDPFVVADWVRELQLYCTAPLDATTVGLALDLYRDYKLAWWDCSILASALLAGCRYILSEDMQHQQIIRSVRLINPFLIGPADILAPN